MAISAYIFVECTPGKALEVSSKLRKIEKIKQCHAVTGPIDVIAFIEVEDINQLGKFLVEKIQSVGGVIRTSTNIVAE